MSIALLEAPNRPIFPVQPTKFKLVVNLKAALSAQLAAPAQVWNWHDSAEMSSTEIGLLTWAKQTRSIETGAFHPG